MTAIVTVPSFLNAIITELANREISPETCELRKAVLVGANLRDENLGPNALAQKMMKAWPIELYGSYGNTELHGSMSECSSGCGAHIHPDVVVAEILDDQGQPVKMGYPGHLVITTLNTLGTPLVRYKNRGYYIYPGTLV